MPLNARFFRVDIYIASLKKLERDPKALCHLPSEFSAGYRLVR